MGQIFENVRPFPSYHFNKTYDRSNLQTNIRILSSTCLGLFAPGSPWRPQSNPSPSPEPMCSWLISGRYQLPFSGHQEITIGPWSLRVTSIRPPIVILPQPRALSVPPTHTRHDPVPPARALPLPERIAHRTHQTRTHRPLPRDRNA